MQHLETITFPHDLSEFDTIIDVRSPEEYQLDHIPGAVNLPVLSNEQRKQVGTIYKQNPFEARKLGAGMVSANVAHHLQTFLADKPADYSPLLYCWRGGMRSRSFTIILKSIGWKPHLIRGGYRSFRQHVVTEIDEILACERLNIQVLSGLTGVGKTRLLKAIEAEGGQIIDLEGLANHKGSLLGESPDSDQPTQKKFETLLWHQLSLLDLDKPVFIEAESNRIGNVHCPPALWKALNSARVINVELPTAERIKLLREDYPHFQDKPAELLDLLDVLVRLRGKERVDQWRELVEQADWDRFVESILIYHYDLCYRKPGHEKSNYQQVTETIEVKDATLASYADTAKHILSTIK